VTETDVARDWGIQQHGDCRAAPTTDPCEQAGSFRSPGRVVTVECICELGDFLGPDGGDQCTRRRARQPQSLFAGGCRKQGELVMPQRRGLDRRETPRASEQRSGVEWLGHSLVFSIIGNGRRASGDGVGRPGEHALLLTMRMTRS
jgi:hypothetical protein